MSRVLSGRNGLATSDRGRRTKRHALLVRAYSFGSRSGDSKSSISLRSCSSVLSGSSEAWPRLKGDVHSASMTGPGWDRRGVAGAVGGAGSSSLSDRRSRSSAGALRGLDLPAVSALVAFAFRGRARLLVARCFLAGLARFARGRRWRAAPPFGRVRLAWRGRARLRARFNVRRLDRLRIGAAPRFLFRFDLDLAIVQSFRFDGPPISII